MNDRTLEQVPATCADLYRRGLAALEKSEANSAIASFVKALEIEPGFVGCREALRRAQRSAGGKPGFWKRIFCKGRLAPTLSEAEVLVHLQPLKTISLAEQVLNRDPGNTTAHKLLARGALAADLPRTAVLSLEALASSHPYHRGIQLELAEALARSGETSSAAAIYGLLLKDNPQDGKVMEALRRISAQSVAVQAPTPDKGDVLEGPAASAHTPVPATLVSTDDAIIQRFEPLLVHGPKNIRILKNLAEAYARKMVFDKALSYYQRALKIAGGKNIAIEAAIAQTTLKKIDWELKHLDPKAPGYAARCERMQNQRLEYQWQTMAESH